MVAFQTFFVFGNPLMHIRRPFNRRPMKTKIMAIGTAAHDKQEAAYDYD
jgi:hypothetical protein